MTSGSQSASSQLLDHRRVATGRTHGLLALVRGGYDGLNTEPRAETE